MYWIWRLKEVTRFLYQNIILYQHCEYGIYLHMYSIYNNLLVLSLLCHVSIFSHSTFYRNCLIDKNMQRNMMFFYLNQNLYVCTLSCLLYLCVSALQQKQTGWFPKLNLSYGKRCRQHLDFVAYEFTCLATRKKLISVVFFTSRFHPLSSHTQNSFLPTTAESNCSSAYNFN